MNAPLPGPAPTPLNLPLPGGKQAPKKFTGDYDQVQSFIDTYERLLNYHRVTIAGDRCRYILPYVSRRVREVIEALPSYQTGNWTTLRQDILRLYDADQWNARYKKRDLESFTRQSRRLKMNSLGSWRKYCRDFIRVGGWLLHKGIITEAEMNGYFWVGIGKRLRGLIDDKFMARNPPPDRTQPYDREEVSKLVESFLQRGKFEEAYLASDEDEFGTDWSGDSDSEVASSSEGDDIVHALETIRRKGKLAPKHKTRHRSGNTGIGPELAFDRAEDLAAKNRLETPRARYKRKDQEGVEEIIQQLGQMSLSDTAYTNPAYAMLYFKALKQDPDIEKVIASPTMLLQHFRAKQANGSGQGAAARYPNPRPFERPAPPHMNVQSAITGTPRMGPGACFGCGKPGHMIPACPDINSQIKEGLIRKDEGGRIVHGNGFPIRRTGGECILAAAARDRENGQGGKAATVSFASRVSWADESSNHDAGSWRDRPYPHTPVLSSAYGKTSRFDKSQDESYEADGEYAAANLITIADLASEDDAEVYWVHQEETDGGESEYEVFAAERPKRKGAEERGLINGREYATTRAQRAERNRDKAATAQMTPRPVQVPRIPGERPTHPRTNNRAGQLAGNHSANTQAPAAQPTAAASTPSNPKTLEPALPAPQTADAAADATSREKGQWRKKTRNSANSPFAMHPVDIPGVAFNPDQDVIMDDTEAWLRSQLEPDDKPAREPRKRKDPEPTREPVSVTEPARNKRYPKQSHVAAETSTSQVLQQVLDTPVQLSIGKILGVSKDMAQLLVDNLKPKTHKDSNSATVLEIEAASQKKRSPLIVVNPTCAGQEITGIVDTGAEISIIRRDVFEKYIPYPFQPQEEIKIRDANSGYGALIGYVPHVELKFGGVPTYANLWVSDSLPFPMLLGINWQVDNLVSIVQRTSGTYLAFNGHRDWEGYELQVRRSIPRERVALAMQAERPMRISGDPESPFPWEVDPNTERWQREEPAPQNESPTGSRSAWVFSVVTHNVPQPSERDFNTNLELEEGEVVRAEEAPSGLVSRLDLGRVSYRMNLLPRLPPTIPTTVRGQRVIAQLDAASTASYMSERLWRSTVRTPIAPDSRQLPPPQARSHDRGRTLGTTNDCLLQVGRASTIASFQVVTNLNRDILLGRDWLIRNEVEMSHWEGSSALTIHRPTRINFDRMHLIVEERGGISAETIAPQVSLTRQGWTRQAIGASSYVQTTSVNETRHRRRSRTSRTPTMGSESSPPSSSDSSHLPTPTHEVRSGESSRRNQGVRAPPPYTRNPTPDVLTISGMAAPVETNENSTREEIFSPTRMDAMVRWTPQTGFRRIRQAIMGRNPLPAYETYVHRAEISREPLNQVFSNLKTQANSNLISKLISKARGRNNKNEMDKEPSKKGIKGAGQGQWKDISPDEVRSTPLSLPLPTNRFKPPRTPVVLSSPPSEIISFARLRIPSPMSTTMPNISTILPDPEIDASQVPIISMAERPNDSPITTSIGALTMKHGRVPRTRRSAFSFPHFSRSPLLDSTQLIEDALVDARSASGRRRGGEIVLGATTAVPVTTTSDGRRVFTDLVMLDATFYYRPFDISEPVIVDHVDIYLRAFPTVLPRYAPPYFPVADIAGLPDRDRLGPARPSSREDTLSVPVPDPFSRQQEAVKMDEDDPAPLSRNDALLAALQTYHPPFFSSSDPTTQQLIHQSFVSEVAEERQAAPSPEPIPAHPNEIVAIHMQHNTEIEDRPTLVNGSPSPEPRWDPSQQPMSPHDPDAIMTEGLQYPEDESSAEEGELREERRGSSRKQEGRLVGIGPEEEGYPMKMERAAKIGRAKESGTFGNSSTLPDLRTLVIPEGCADPIPISSTIGLIHKTNGRPTNGPSLTYLADGKPFLPVPANEGDHPSQRTIARWQVQLLQHGWSRPEAHELVRDRLSAFPSSPRNSFEAVPIHPSDPGAARVTFVPHTASVDLQKGDRILCLVDFNQNRLSQLVAADTGRHYTVQLPRPGSNGLIHVRSRQLSEANEPDTSETSRTVVTDEHGNKILSEVRPNQKLHNWSRTDTSRINQYVVELMRNMGTTTLPKAPEPLQIIDAASSEDEDAGSSVDDDVSDLDLTDAQPITLPEDQVSISPCTSPPASDMAKLTHDEPSSAWDGQSERPSTPLDVPDSDPDSWQHYQAAKARLDGAQIPGRQDLVHAMPQSTGVSFQTSYVDRLSRRPGSFNDPFNDDMDLVSLESDSTSGDVEMPDLESVSAENIADAPRTDEGLMGNGQTEREYLRSRRENGSGATPAIIFLPNPATAVDYLLRHGARPLSPHQLPNKTATPGVWCRPFPDDPDAVMFVEASTLKYSAGGHHLAQIVCDIVTKTRGYHGKEGVADFVARPRQGSDAPNHLKTVYVPALFPQIPGTTIRQRYSDVPLEDQVHFLDLSGVPFSAEARTDALVPAEDWDILSVTALSLYGMLRAVTVGIIGAILQEAGKRRPFYHQPLKDFETAHSTRLFRELLDFGTLNPDGKNPSMFEQERLLLQAARGVAAANGQHGYAQIMDMWAHLTFGDGPLITRLLHLGILDPDDSSARRDPEGYDRVIFGTACRLVSIRHQQELNTMLEQASAENADMHRAIVQHSKTGRWSPKEDRKVNGIKNKDSREL